MSWIILFFGLGLGGAAIHAMLTDNLIGFFCNMMGASLCFCFAVIIGLGERKD